MYQILLVEDDLKICDVINTYFLSRSDNQLKLNIIHNGNDALDALYENQYDLVLLDIMLPGADGFQICKSIRENNDTPTNRTLEGGSKINNNENKKHYCNDCYGSINFSLCPEHWYQDGEHEQECGW